MDVTLSVWFSYVTSSGITKSFTSLPFKNIRWATYSGFESPETKVMPHHEAMSEIYTAAMFGHQPKADFPMYVTLLGMVTEVRPEQYLNVLSVDNQQLPR